MPTQEKKPVLKNELIQQAFKFELDPTPAQARRFASHAGAARFAYNWGISQIAQAMDVYNAAKDAGDSELPGYLDHFGLCRLWTQHKDTPENELGWVGEHFVGTFQAALRDAHGAWKAFHDSRKGRRKGRPVGRPRFKSRRKSPWSFQVHGATLRVEEFRMAPSRAKQAPGKKKQKPKKVPVQVYRNVTLPKIGPVRVKEQTRKLVRLIRKGLVECPPCEGTGAYLGKDKTGNPEMKKCKPCKESGKIPYARIVRGTVSRTAAGRWYIALTVERVRDVRTAPSKQQRDGGTIGVDWGVRHLATLSTGQVIDNPRYLERAQAKLRRARQDLSRKEKGSKRRDKARHRVAVLDGRVAALRLDHVEQVTSRLVHHHERIVVEGWDVAETLANGSSDIPKKIRRDRNRALADTGIGKARWMVEHKSAWYGTKVTVSGRHEPTGRTCSACGQVRTKPVQPAEELFTCPSCGYSGDRRVNTARVLSKLPAGNVAPSSGETQNARGGDVRPAALRRGGRSPSKREARSRPSGRGQTGAPDP